jgi:hypothetical protein
MGKVAWIFEQSNTEYAIGRDVLFTIRKPFIVFLRRAVVSSFVGRLFAHTGHYSSSRLYARR